jgi:hypothetical protein
MPLSFTHLLLNTTNSTHKSTLSVSAHNHTYMYMYIVNWKKKPLNSSKTVKERSTKPYKNQFFIIENCKH